MSPRTLAVLVAGLLSACLTPPHAVVRTPKGEIRAPDSELAVRAADYVDITRLQLQKEIPGLLDTPADVWIQKKAYAGALLWFRAGSLHAFTLESDDLPHPRIHVPIDTFESSITHELVHALLGPDWDTAPAVIEEGLCDIMSVDLAGDSQRRLNLLMSATLGPDLAEELGADRVVLHRLLEARESLDLHQEGGDFAAYAYGVGYVLVSRIRDRFGLDYLHQMAIEAAHDGHERIPGPWIFQAADVDPDRPLASRISDEIDAAFFQHLVDSGELRRMIEDFRSEAPLTRESLESIVLTYAADSYRETGLKRRLVDLPGYGEWERRNRDFLYQ